MAVSLKRGNRDETTIDTAVVIANSSTTTTGNSTQVQAGAMPQARMNTNTTTRLSPRLNIAVRTTARGITRRGNWVFLTTVSWLTIDCTAVTVASEKKPNSTMLNSSSTGYSGTWSPMRKTWVNTAKSTPNSISGRASDQR